jgi:phage I-like protein
LLISTTDLPEGKAPEWIQVFPLKRFEVVPEGGEEDITVERLNEIIANFAEQGTDIPIDADHSYGISFGWITAMEIRTGLEVKDGVDPNGLWEKVSWNENGRSAVESKEYRYISPSFRKNYVDPETGESKGWRQLTASLTNLPFYDSMQELIAASINKRTIGGFEMKELLKKLGLAENATEAEAIKKIEELQADGAVIAEIIQEAEAIKDSVELPEGQTQEVIAASLKDRAKRGAAVKTLLKAAAGQAKEFTAVRTGLQLPKATTASQIIERAKPVGDTETVKLRDELKTMRDQQLKRDQDGIVARAKNEGRVLASDNDTQQFLREYVVDRGLEKAEAYVTRMPVIPALANDKTRTRRMPVDSNGKVQLTALQKATCRSMNIKEEDYAKTLEKQEA